MEIEPFGQTRMVYWEALEYLGLADEIQRSIGFDRWIHIFEIVKHVYRELPLEDLSMFEIDST